MAKPKRRNGKSGAAGTSLDTRQRVLLEQEEKVRAERQQLEQFVAKAPALKRKAEERRREELITRASAGSRRIDAPTLLDKRHDAIVAGPSARGRPPGVLKSQVRQARITFFGLLVAVLLLAFWLWSILH